MIASEGKSPSLQSKILVTAQHADERRTVPRISGPFPAVVLNLADCVEGVGVRATLENFSASGFYLRLAQQVREGEKLLVVTHISSAVVVVCGSVTRVEELEGGAYGMAVIIAQHQIFSLRSTQQQTQTVSGTASEFLRTEV